MPKSQSRNVYEKLSEADQSNVDIRTGRKSGVIFTKDWPAISFEKAIREVAGTPGAYTTKPGDVVRNSRMTKKMRGRSF